MITHTKEKPFKCNQCDKTFKWKHGLTFHLKKHNGEERSFQCNQCDSAFSSEYELKRHLRKHTKEKPFKCNHCEKVYSAVCSDMSYTDTHCGEAISMQPL